MKKIILISVIFISINCLSQPHTNNYEKNLKRSTALNIASGVGIWIDILTGGNILIKYPLEAIVAGALFLRFGTFEKANTPVISNNNQCIINSERRIPRKYYRKYKQQKQK